MKELEIHKKAWHLTPGAMISRFIRLILSDLVKYHKICFHMGLTK